MMAEDVYDDDENRAQNGQVQNGQTQQEQRSSGLTSRVQRSISGSGWSMTVSGHGAAAQLGQLAQHVRQAVRAQEQQQQVGSGSGQDARISSRRGSQQEQERHEASTIFPEGQTRPSAAGTAAALMSVVNESTRQAAPRTDARGEGGNPNHMTVSFVDFLRGLTSIRASGGGARLS